MCHGHGSGAHIFAIVTRVMPAPGNPALYAAVLPVCRRRRMTGRMGINPGMFRFQFTAASLVIQALDQCVGDSVPRFGAYGQRAVPLRTFKRIGSRFQLAKVRHRHPVIRGFIQFQRIRLKRQGLSRFVLQFHKAFGQDGGIHRQPLRVSFLVDADYRTFIKIKHQLSCSFLEYSAGFLRTLICCYYFKP